MIKYVVFDLGGVIVELDPQRPVDRFREMGVKDADKLINSYEHKGIFLQFENGELDLEGFRKELSKLAGKELSTDDIYWGWMGFMLDVSQEKLDYMQALREKYHVCILSNTNPIIMHWANSGVFCPAGRPLSDYCDKIYASYEMKMTKPNPLIFEAMMADAQMNPAEILFIDDGIRNVEAASRLGIHTYLPKNGEDWRSKVDELLQELA
ncbi:HAD family phosphatase [Parabacteroides sp. OttesenSCG-928-J18]|nr:HAD family phosphatase [Parabacteroides sp. OttesenSCG-928-J18]